MTIDRIGLYTGAGVGVLGLLTLAWQLVRGAVRIAARVDEVVDDWQGVPARPGVAARPGVLERISHIEERVCDVADRVGRVEAQLRPNGGSSLRDAVNRVDARTAQIASDISPDTE
ncbi:hypothetical protein [Streptomyces sp. NBC_01803]|uniref:hypothetical protein n=1 Tax=Streptomyces sp. NBC_01803 TaxID=2975946 RepID=UPI002DD9E454|nr:hypothetical protein [Streptomyces sp. NBC_01803]WSA44977.1 hypothetical protein OIE51_12605 [Streptomyces sp. NBC_01803]